MPSAQVEALAREEEEEAQRLSQLKTLFDPKTLVKKGLCPISKIKGETALKSHSIYYEQHGTGPQKIVFIMGLNASSFGWEGQVRHFAPIERYSLAVFDNRGVGNSDTPRGPYSTSAMADDVVTLMDYLGWTQQRQLHIVGASLGGMISLELSTKIPQRIASVTLLVTTAGHTPRPFGNLSPRKGAALVMKAMTAKDPKAKIPFVLDMLFPQPYLDAPSEVEGLTNREAHTQEFLNRVSFTRPQGLVGSLSQTFASLTHYVSPARLRAIDASIPKIAILTGDEDPLVDPSNSKELSQAMPSAEYVIWEKTGHGLPAQWPERMSKFLEGVFDEGWAKGQKQINAVAPAGTAA